MGSNDQPAYRKAGCTLFNCLLTVSIILSSFCKARIKTGETVSSLSGLFFKQIQEKVAAHLRVE